MTTIALKNDLNWTVGKRPSASQNIFGEWEQDFDRWAVYRSDTDTRLGYVGTDFEFLQNDDLKAIINPLVQEEVLTVENQGFLGGGKLVFIQAKINQEYQVLGEDYKGYITLLNGHVGNATCSMGVTNTRVICGNTFKMAQKDMTQKFRHSLGVKERVLESDVVRNYVDNAMGIYAAQAQQLDKTPCSTGTFHTVLEKVFKKRVDELKQLEQLERLFRSGAGNSGQTLYDAFNAITDYASHKGTNPASRFNYANFGTGAKRAESAMAVLSELALV